MNVAGVHSGLQVTVTGIDIKELIKQRTRDRGTIMIDKSASEISISRGNTILA